jgi:hypothetical protein
VPNFNAVSMAEDEQVLFRPVLRGMLRAESLIDGSVDLNYVMLLNEAIDIEQINDGRAIQAQRQDNRRG